MLPALYQWKNDTSGSWRKGMQVEPSARVGIGAYKRKWLQINAMLALNESVDSQN